MESVVKELYIKTTLTGHELALVNNKTQSESTGSPLHHRILHTSALLDYNCPQNQTKRKLLLLSVLNGKACPSIVCSLKYV